MRSISSSTIPLKLCRAREALLATDIDGTLIAPGSTLREEEASYLERLQLKGLILLFATGRNRAVATHLLKDLKCPFYLSTQNGAELFSFPGGELIKSHPIGRDLLEEGLKLGWTAVGSHASYYRGEKLRKEEREHLLARASHFQEIYLEGEPDEPIFSLKAFGERGDLLERLIPFEGRGYTASLTRDVLRREISTVQLSNPSVDKGLAVQTLQAHLPHKRAYIIGAGDDLNDLPLFREAHLKVAMEDGAEALLELADLIVPSSKIGGLFTALEKIFIL